MSQQIIPGINDSCSGFWVVKAEPDYDLADYTIHEHAEILRQDGKSNDHFLNF